MKVKKVSPAVRKISFRVTTKHPLPIGEQIFITGNVETLGPWRPDGFALTRTDDLRWEGVIEAPSDLTLEYKITRGSWDAEEVTSEGVWPANSRCAPGGDRVEERVVLRWRDHRVPSPQITGDYRVHEHVTGARLRRHRTVIVWLPPSYAHSPDRRYPVLYMQDGQQVFDPNTATLQHDWQVDEWCTKLIAEKRLQEIIVVGIYSTADRYEEYAPAKNGEAYTAFVVEELKPFIDREYRTMSAREHTAVAGSSMGAGISFYMAWSRPDIFFAAACLSPAFEHKQDDAILSMVAQTKKAPDLKLYLYNGHGDDLERRLIQDLYAMRDALASKGITPGDQLLIVEDPDGLHNETTWAKHTDHWLLFMFGR